MNSIKIRWIIRLVKSLPNQLIMQDNIIIIKSKTLNISQINSTDKTQIVVDLNLGDVKKAQL